MLRSVFEELAETLAAQSVESATEFANEVLSEVERVQLRLKLTRCLISRTTRWMSRLDLMALHVKFTKSYVPIL